MYTSKIIFENKPKSFASKKLTSLGIYSAMLVFFYFVTQSTSILYIIPVVFLFDMAVDEISVGNYDGWKLTNTDLVLMKSTIKGIKTITLKYSEVERIVYYAGGYRAGSPRLNIELANKKYSCNTACSIFQLADTLKYFQTKGIKVALLKKDDEIQLYLDGKIDKIPMQNV